VVPDPNRRKAQVASIVILVTIVGWMGASWIGGMIGLPVRYAFLFDFAAIAALIWAMVVLFQVWKSGQD
jgi:uncharacterized protein DUF5337